MRSDGFLLHASLRAESTFDEASYPFSIAAIRALRGSAGIRFGPQVTYLVGENGSGKSTLIEALAIKSGFNAEGGTTNFQFATRRSESPLHSALRVARSVRRPRTGFFFRGESFFNVATEIEEIGRTGGAGPLIDAYGGISLHEQSHGESFLALIKHRFGPEGLYILDEPESALSPSRQLAVLMRIDQLVRQGSQFIIATHSPILLAYPDALIYELSQSGMRAIDYDEAEIVTVTRDFMANRERFVRALMGDS